MVDLILVVFLIVYLNIYFLAEDWGISNAYNVSDITPKFEYGRGGSFCVYYELLVNNSLQACLLECFP